MSGGVTPSRRGVLAGLGVSAGLAGLPAWANEAAATWRLGFQNAPDAGLPPTALRRVHGRAPAGLAGTLFRNGPAQFTWGGGRIGHWFDGDGFVRRIAFQDGEARLSGRFVDTNKRRVDKAADDVVMPGFGTAGRPTARVTSPDDTNAANTSVMMMGAELWALWEGGSPFAMDPETLATRGVKTIREDLAGMPFSAHPKVDAAGTVWNFGGFGNRVFVWSLAPDGTVRTSGVLPLPRSSYMHDWAVSKTKLIFPLQPWTIAKSTPPFVDSLVWRPQDGLQILVVDKDDFTRRTVFELPAASFFHTGDAWEEADGTIHFDACLSDDPTFGALGAKDLVAGRAVEDRAPPYLALVTLKLDGTAKIERTPVVAEFPRTDPRRQGEVRTRVAHVVDTTPGGWGFQALAVTHWGTGARDQFDFGPDHLVEEHIFVPKPGATGETDAWLIGTSLNLRARASEVHVFDAARVSAGPIVTWRADVAMPLTFHGTWRGA